MTPPRPFLMQPLEDALDRVRRDAATGVRDAHHRRVSVGLRDDADAAAVALGAGAGAGRARTRAVVTRTTASTITALPIATAVVTGSPRIHHPSSTAMTGFTYAYVAAFAAGVCASSHTYAVKPIQEPNTMRYATAARPAAVGWKPRSLRSATAMAEKTRPPNSISHPVATIGSTVLVARRA